MIPVIFGQIPATPDPTTALIGASVLILSAAVAVAFQRFSTVAIKAENDRLGAAIAAAERRCDDRCRDLEKRCQDLDNRLWVSDQNLRACRREMEAWRAQCISPDCPVRSIAMKSVPA